MPCEPPPDGWPQSAEEEARFLPRAKDDRSVGDRGGIRGELDPREVVGLEAGCRPTELLAIEPTVAAFSQRDEHFFLETLFEDEREHVSLERWAAGAEVELDGRAGGLEVLVLDGSFMEAGETFETQSWLRLPKGDQTTASAGDDGCRVWIKRGHLKSPPSPPAV